MKVTVALLAMSFVVALAAIMYAVSTNRSSAASLCEEVEAIKTQIRATVRGQAANAQQYVGRIPGYTQADADRAKRSEQATLRRFGRRSCPR